jgi:hypothetical protein
LEDFVMQAVRCFAILLLAAGWSASIALADIPPSKGGRPQPRPVPVVQGDDPDTDTVPLVIKVDANAQQPVISIPSNFLQVGPDAVPTAPAPTAKPTGFFNPRLRTMIAGIALSSAFVGLMFMRRGKSATRAAAALIVGGGLAFVLLGTAWADIRPPRPIHQVRTTVAINQVGEGKEIVLILDEQTARALVPSRFQIESEAK